jgi:hypothetical protein
MYQQTLRVEARCNLGDEQLAMDKSLCITNVQLTGSRGQNSLITLQEKTDSNVPASRPIQVSTVRSEAVCAP